MLIANGTLKGQFYDEAQIKPQVLIDAFGIPPMNGQPKTFRLKAGMGLIRKDRSNPGEILITPGKAMSPYFTVTTPEGSLSLRYATNRQPIKGGGGYKYTPNKVKSIAGYAEFFFGPNQIEEYVWHYLNPKNAKSPFARAPQYEYFNAAEDAQKEMVYLSAQNDLMQAIFSMPEHELRLRAAGLTFIADGRRVQFNGALTAEVAVIRQRLIKALTDYGRYFIDAWSTAETSVLGVVKMAENLNIIGQYQLAGGTEWRYTEQYGGARIAFANAGQDPLQVLISEVTVQYAVLFPKLKGLVDIAGGISKKASVQAPVAKPVPITAEAVSALPALDLIELAESKEAIAFERGAQKVYSLNPNGSLNKPILPQVKSAKQWRTELAEFLQTDAGKKFREDLEAAIIK